MRTTAKRDASTTHSSCIRQKPNPAAGSGDDVIRRKRDRQQPAADDAAASAGSQPDVRTGETVA